MAGALLIAVALTASCWASPAVAATKHHREKPPPPAEATGQPAPAATVALSGVSCATHLLCWSVGTGAAAAPATGDVGTIDVSRNGGKTWSPEVVPAVVQSLSAISCPTARRCLAVRHATASAAAVVATRDGGVTWVLAHSPAGALDITGVQCTPAGGCLALATDGSVYSTASSNDYGETWTSGGDLPATLAGAGGLSCQSTQDCLVAGYAQTTPGSGAGALASSTDGGETWTSVTLPPGIGLLHGVACNPARCLAVGTTATNTSVVVPGKGVILQSVDGGVTWTTEAHSTSVDDAFAVSCTARVVCVIVGTVWIPVSPPTPVGGVITSSDGGRTWRPAKLQYVPESMAAVDCASAADCVAAGTNVLAHVALPVKKQRRSPRASAYRGGAVQIGVVFPQTEIGGDTGAVRAYAEAAAGLGYRHLLVYDHVLGADPAVHAGWSGPYDIATTFCEPMVLFGYLAAFTDLELVSGIVIGPQRQSALLAKQAAQVDVFCGGRLRLGLGLGWNRVEYDALGKDFTDARQAARRTGRPPAGAVDRGERDHAHV